MKKHAAVLVTALAALMALTVTPSTAATTTPAKHRFGVLAWYNDLGHWGYLNSPKEAECYALDPKLDKGGTIANFTRYKAMFYTDPGCFGIAGPVLGPHDIDSGIESGASSVVLIPADAIPLKPSTGHPAPRDQ